jgi:hypothetical protein
MYQIMKKLGIIDDINDENIVDTIGNSNRRIDYNEFSAFVKEIYMNCKRFGIKPDIIFSWIIDLFSWYSPSGNLRSFVDGKRIESGEERNDQKLAASDLKISSIFPEAKPSPVLNLNTATTINSNPDVIANNITEGFNPKQSIDSLNNMEYPFISKLSK